MQGGTADSVVLFIYVHDSSLTDLFFSVRGVFLETKKLCKPGNPTTENKTTEIKESERGGTA